MPITPWSRYLRVAIAHAIAIATVAAVPAAAAVGELTLFAVTSGNTLLRFSGYAPGIILASTAITGLQPGETIQGIDVRPATGQIVALGSTSRLYVIHPTTGVATAPGAGPFAPALAGTVFGFDFNPVTDRVRVVGDAEQNIRLNPITGGLAGVDTPLAYDSGDPNAGRDPTVTALAYTLNFFGAATTAAYSIDTGLNILVTIGRLNLMPSPASGLLFTVGPLGVDVTDVGGFDIAEDGTAVAALRVGTGRPRLYTIDLTTGAATLVGPIGTTDEVRGLAVATPSTGLVAVTPGDTLLRFGSVTPETIERSTPVSGLQPGETLEGLDVRPATGQLYGLGIAGTSGRLYTLDPITGAAMPIGAVPFSTTLAGTRFGFDFNPVPDRIRVVSDAEENLRLNPDTGAIAATDTNLTPPGQVIAVAYDRNVAGTPATTLFGIDATSDMLVMQGGVDGIPSPNGGVITNVGALGVDTSDLVGFDIVPGSGAAFAALNVGGVSGLYRINLAAGAAFRVGTIGVGAAVRGLTAARPDLSITAPADGTVLPLAVPTQATFTWTPVAGAAQYFFEFTGADRQFANPNGTAPDPVNGSGGAGGRVLVQGISFITTLDAASVSPGRYQVRVAAASAGGAIVGSFSNAVTLTVGNAVAPTARTTITAPAGGSQVLRGAQVTFTWTTIPGVAQYGFEFTGVGRQFANPNESAPDPVNGFGVNGLGGGFAVTGTSFTSPPLNVLPGSYQVRVIGLSSSLQPVGIFSDAVTVVIQ